jgi:hypothetical protein
MKTKITEFWNKIPPHGQSLVELALFFPMILMMLSGLTEFGFLLNDYLNLMDGPREGARLAVDLSPFVGSSDSDDIAFYNTIFSEVQNSIVPYVIDPATDDVVVSVFSVRYSQIFRRYPVDSGVTSTPGYWSKNGLYASKVTDADVNSKLAGITTNASIDGDPDLRHGLVAVELFYAYKQKLALPWITAFVSDPIHLHMMAFSPLPASTPPECPDASNPACPVTP